MVAAAAMVMSSRLMLLQALPLRARLCAPACCPARCFRTAPSPRFQRRSLSFQGLGARGGSSVANLRAGVRREVFGLPLRCSAASASALAASAMAGASSDPPPMYRANVGVCLVNDKNEVGDFNCDSALGIAVF